jgi:hypothetical protein
MDGFLVQYAYPSSLINEHLSEVLNGDLVTNLKAMVMMWTDDHLVQGGWAEKWQLLKL